MIPNVTGGRNENWSSGGGGGTEAGLRKGPWRAEEDSILMEYVRKHGEGNWNAVHRNSGLSRCGKSCRLRWANHLRSNLKKGAISPEEERTILELHAKFGNKWARMAAQLPGRTDNEIKNYWNTRVKRRRRQGLPLYPHDINPFSAPTTPTTPASASAPTTPTPTTFSAPPHFYFPAHIQSLSSISSPHTLPFSPSSSSSHSPSFTFQRDPPILGPPTRTKSLNRFNGQFSHPLSSNLPQNSNAVLIPSPRLQHSQLASFQFPTHFPSTLMENLRTQSDSQHMAMSLVNSELPLNQIIMESEAVPPINHSGLLDDLFVDSQALDASNETHCLVSHDDKRFLFAFNQMDDFHPAYFHLGEAQTEEAREAVRLGQDEWSKPMKGIPPPPSEGEWYENGGEISNVHSSYLTRDEGGLDLHNLTSFYQVPSESDSGRTPTPCSWDNFP